MAENMAWRIWFQLHNGVEEVKNRNRRRKRKERKTTITPYSPSLGGLSARKSHQHPSKISLGKAEIP